MMRDFRGVGIQGRRFGRAHRERFAAASLLALAPVFLPACGSSQEDAPATAGSTGSSGGESGAGPTAGSSGSSSGASSTSSATGGGATGGVTAGASGSGASGSGASGSGSTGAGVASAAQIAIKLGRSPHFLVGMGNDLDNDHDNDGAYTLGTTLDLHYAYLVGLPGEGGWPDWNANGSFVNILADSAAKHGVVPMYTLYAMAAHGENNIAALATEDFMRPYWQGAKLLFQRIADSDKPAVVHIEPDFWGFAEQASHEDPTSTKVLIGGLATECADQPENLVGLGHCFLVLARMYAPKAIVGFHASQWGGAPADMVKFLTAVGAADADIIVEDMLDRDAGCYEAHTDPSCQRNDGPWYWDESNQKSPNFHDYLSYAKAIGDGLGKPILWWQLPFGVPSDTPGGSADHYRDNRVHYIFNHVDEFVAAGGLGVTFGTGAGNQTFINSDGGQFKTAVTTYFANPVMLP